MTSATLTIGQSSIGQNDASIEDIVHIARRVNTIALSTDPAFIERSSGAIIVLLVFLVIMNVAAILLRRRFERRW